MRVDRRTRLLPADGRLPLQVAGCWNWNFLFTRVSCTTRRSSTALVNPWRVILAILESPGLIPMSHCQRRFQRELLQFTILNRSIANDLQMPRQFSSSCTDSLLILLRRTSLFDGNRACLLNSMLWSSSPKK